MEETFTANESKANGEDSSWTPPNAEGGLRAQIRKVEEDQPELDMVEESGVSKLLVHLAIEPGRNCRQSLFEHPKTSQTEQVTTRWYQHVGLTPTEEIAKIGI